MTMAMRCQKSNRLGKQQLCMCIMLFCTLISLLSLHNFNVKMPNCMFNGGHKQWTTNFLSLSKLQCSPQEYQLLENLPTFDTFSNQQSKTKRVFILKVMF